MAMIGKQRLSPDRAIYVTHLYYGARQRVALPFPMYFESVEAASKTAAASVVFSVFLGMHAVQQMLAFLFQICRQASVPRSRIYEQFFQSPFVKQYCDQEGIEETTLEASRRRCPFLLNILDACGVIRTEQSDVHVQKLLLVPSLVKPYGSEEAEVSKRRLQQVVEAWPNHPERLRDGDLSIVRELFGPTFLTDGYYLKDFIAIHL